MQWCRSCLRGELEQVPCPWLVTGLEPGRALLRLVLQKNRRRNLFPPNGIAPAYREPLLGGVQMPWTTEMERWAKAASQ